MKSWKRSKNIIILDLENKSINQPKNHYINLNLTTPNDLFKYYASKNSCSEKNRNKILNLMRIMTVPYKEVWTVQCAEFYSAKALWDLCNLSAVVFSSCKEAMGSQGIYHFALSCWKKWDIKHYNNVDNCHHYR